MDIIRKIAEILPPQEFINSSFKENPIDLFVAAEFYRILNEFLTDQHQFDEQSLSDTYTRCEAIKDHLWEVINTGHFSKVNRIHRQLLTLASLEKAVLLLVQAHFNRNDTIELRDTCIRELDNGLLLGCPFDHPSHCHILNDCLKILQNSNLHGDSSAAIDETMPVPTTINLNSHNELVREPNELCDLNILSKPSVEHFQENYFNKCWPVILTDCMGQWPATIKWTQPSYLLNVCANRTVPVEIGSSYTNENWSQDLVKFEDFFRRQFLNDSNSSTGCDQSTSNVEYLAQHNLFDQIPTLRHDIIIPEYCCAINRNVETKGGGDDEDDNNDIDVDIKAWLGPEGTTSPMHIDEKHNLLCQVFGTKRIILAAPTDSINLYPFDGDMLKNTAQIDPEHLDVERFPLARQVKFYHLTLHKGEILYIPPKWWHFVRSLSKSFSVSFWWE